MEIKREIESSITKAFGHYPVVTITGPRQSGKTTLVKMLFSDKPHCSLEDPDVRRFAESDPRTFLAGFPDGAVSMRFNAYPNCFPTFRESSMRRSETAFSSSQVPAIFF